MINRIFAVLLAALVIISFSAVTAHEDDNNGCSNGRCVDGDDHDKGKGNDKDKDKDHGDDDGNEDDGDNGDGGDGGGGYTGEDGFTGTDWFNWNFPSGGHFYFGNGDCSRILILEEQLRSNKYTNTQKLRAERMIISVAWEGYKTTPKQFYNKYCKPPNLWMKRIIPTYHFSPTPET